MISLFPDPQERRDVGGKGPPQTEGEVLAAWYRLVIAGLLVLFIAVYWSVVSVGVRTALLESLGLSAAWAASSAAVLGLARRRRLRPWHSYLTIGLDLALVTVLQLVVIDPLPLHFINGPVTGLYFVVVGLAGLRGSRRLVLAAGAAAGLIHIVLGTVLFQRFLPELNVIATPGGHAMGLNYLDEVGKGLAMATVGVVIGFVTDSLRTSERRYRHLFDHIPDGALIVDEQGRIGIANQRLADMIGVKRESLAGRAVATVLKRAEGDPREAALLVRSDGIEVPVRTASQPIEYRGGSCLEVSVQDVTEQVRLERQLSRSQRMETVGQLAGGLTHDFNNLLGGIIGAASLSARALTRIGDAGRRERIARRIETIRERGEAARGVVRRLLAFTRRPQFDGTRLDLVQIVRDCAEICRNTLRKDVEVSVVVAVTAAPVDGDAGALTQALLNLCINAEDAMPDGGTLTIRLGQAGGDAGGDGDADRAHDAFVIEVRDTGVGMDDSTRERIFDPFFSTKHDAVGTGLGLSMVESIARDHGGYVEVESAPGRGSAFRLVLAGSRISLLPDAPAGDLPRGTGRILFVDDDDLVRSTVTGMLAELGYEVVAAASGAEALRLFESRAGRFDLLILDLMMPGLDGIQTLERIRARGDTTRALIATGFWSADRSAEIDDLGVAGVLRKPFSISTLAGELKRISGAGGGGA